VDVLTQSEQQTQGQDAYLHGSPPKTIRRADR
jgi:hypothetical protein